MDEWPQQSRTCKLFKLGTWFCESSPNALNRPYVEPLTNERVQPDPGGDDVAACVFPRELDLIERIGFDQCELVTLAGPLNVPSPFA